MSDTATGTNERAEPAPQDGKQPLSRAPATRRKARDAALGDSTATHHADEYLTIEEVAARLKLKPKTVRNKMAQGVFRLGVHYVRPPGMTARFKWSAVVAWIETAGEEAKSAGAIPMARGYFLQ